MAFFENFVSATMWLFQYDPREKRKWRADDTVQRNKEPITRVKNCFSSEDVQPNTRPNSKALLRLQKAEACRATISEPGKVRKNFLGVSDESMNARKLLRMEKTHKP